MTKLNKCVRCNGIDDALNWQKIDWTKLNALPLTKTYVSVWYAIHIFVAKYRFHHFETLIVKCFSFNLCHWCCSSLGIACFIDFFAAVTVLSSLLSLTCQYYIKVASTTTARHTVYRKRINLIRMCHMSLVL